MIKGIFGSLIILKQKINQYCVCLDGHVKQRQEHHPNTYFSKILQEIIPKVTRAECKCIILAWNDGKGKADNPSNYCPDCLPFSSSKATSKSSPDEGDGANKGSNNLCCLTQSIDTHEPTLLKTRELLMSRKEL